ncbi:MAG: ABC transporter substrate-binding protein [Phycisphaeraceae bacterium]|nr:ABC transporter substrate-binding protein [Phycisphaeraceae bacterium]
MRTPKLMLALIAAIPLAAGAWYLIASSPSRETPPVTTATMTMTTGPAQPARRVISLAPSITETLFAVGAGNRVVGVTRYCLYPPQAKTVEQVGGYLDHSMEAMLRLKPDLVIAGEEHHDSLEQLRKLGLPILIVHHRMIGGILESIGLIGQATDSLAGAEDLAADIRGRMERVRRKVAGLPRPRVMVCLGRGMGGGVGEIFIAGKDNFYDEIIELAGGANVFDAAIVKSPAISDEGVLRLNPDVIIDMVPSPEERGTTAAAIAEDWKTLSQVAAVKAGRVHVLTGDYVVIPGPRFARTLEDAARVIQPEARWNEP